MWFEDGREPREGLRTRYGVEFPAEYFAVADAHQLPVDFLFRPWLEPVPPDLFPILRTKHREAPPGPSTPTPPPPSARYGGEVLCYRLSELQAGRTTVFGVAAKRSDDGEVLRCGDSLLAVVHEYVAGILALEEWEMVQPFNWGAGALSSEDVDETRGWLELVESLLRDEGKR